ncbi:carboxylate--amine ligase [Sporosalibacterium faouarense]|uniref:carboxylate--amine ligase n=1 Tax=Sporosalibacterium faouarense TaxID=516123 RepID=UPI00141CE271|nr:carboxylate--amine ligase [Sporosalibacterium faouarense]MTI46331.1 carboxylate--amine ligase [Bacillota bacterium]
MKNKAVILGANYYIGLSAIRCLGIHGIEVVAVDYSWKGTYGFYSKYCSETLIAPHYKKDSKGLIEFLIEYAKKQNEIPVLIPCGDPYVELIDEYLLTLKEYYLIPQTEQGLYTKVMNKGTLHSLAEKHEVAVPETVKIDDENFRQKVEEIIKFPCLVKPTDSPTFVSIFRKKMFTVNNMQELDEAVEKAKDAGLEVIIQRIIPGFDDHMHTFDAYLNQDAKVTHWLTCQKYRQYPINFGASVYTGQKYIPELYDIGARFLEDIGFKGFAEIEFKKDAETGKFYLIEVNVRLSNLNSLVYKAGLNMPYITYRDLIGNPLEPKAIKNNTKLVFWYAYEDILAVRNYIRKKQLTISQVLRSYFQPKAYAIWDWKDIKPALVFFRTKVGRAFKKIFSK